VLGNIKFGIKYFYRTFLAKACLLRYTIKMSQEIPGGYPEDVFSAEDDPSTTILRDPEQVKEKEFLEEFINTSEMRIRVGSEAIVKILMNANKVGQKSPE
jgi:hypothetical protein